MAERPPEPDDGIPAPTETQLQELADQWGLDVADLDYPTTPEPGHEQDEGEQPQP